MRHRDTCGHGTSEVGNRLNAVYRLVVWQVLSLQIHRSLLLVCSLKYFSNNNTKKVVLV